MGLGLPLLFVIHALRIGRLDDISQGEGVSQEDRDSKTLAAPGRGTLKSNRKCSNEDAIMDNDLIRNKCNGRCSNWKMF